jgi:hypothetical protein
MRGALVLSRLQQCPVMVRQALLLVAADRSPATAGPH